MNWMTRLVQGDGRNDGGLVLRTPASLAPPEFSAEVGIIHLNLSQQQVGLLPLSHCAQDLVVQQPGCVVVHSQVVADLQRRDPGFGLADHVKVQKLSSKRQFCVKHDVPAVSVA